MKQAEVSKRSRQREAILSVLQGTKSHPTANWVYDEVRKMIPNISLGTVYRNLSKLSESGLIQKLDVGEGTDRFDANYEPHYHLYCNFCQRLLDLDLPYDARLNQKAEAIQGTEIQWHQLVFYGKCCDCCSN